MRTERTEGSDAGRKKGSQFGRPYGTPYLQVAEKARAISKVARAYVVFIFTGGE